MEDFRGMILNTATGSCKGLSASKPVMGSVLAALYLLVVDGLPAMASTMSGPDPSAGAMLQFGMVLGLFLALFLSGLNMFFALREGAYVWFSVLAVCMAVYFFLVQTPLLFPADLPAGQIRGVGQMFFGGAVIAGGCFARSFMQTAVDPPGLAQADRLLLIMILVGGLLILAASAGQGGMYDRIVFLLALTAALVLAAASLLAWIKGVRRARFLFLGSLAVGGGGLVEGLVARGILPAHPLLSHLFEVGYTGAAVLLACAMGDSIRALHHERESLRISERRHKVLAVTDVLTGLFNMRYFRVQIDLEIQRAMQLGQPFTLMMMDIDNFKVFNDRYGHLEGDRVLRLLGRLINSVIREQDVACRYGGEEFALILPGGDCQAAIHIHERLQAALQHCERHERAELPHAVTLSVGVAQYLPGEDADDLIGRADNALYSAKQCGRDQLVISETDAFSPDPTYPDCFTGA